MQRLNRVVAGALRSLAPAPQPRAASWLAEEGARASGGCAAEAHAAASHLSWPAHALPLEEEAEVESVFPGGHPADELLLMAVPKRKTTPSRKGIRSTGKHLRFASVYSTCATCGKIRRQHAHCPFCLGGGAKSGGGETAGGGEAPGGAAP